MAKKEFEYEITSDVGIIGGNESAWHKAVKRVSWNGNPAKLDIRDWNGNPDAKYVMGKGVSLTDEEADALVSILLRAGYGDPEDVQNIINER